MNKNWADAQRYCREKYTDLATIDNMNDMIQLMKSVNNGGHQHVWIGLHRTSVYKRHWSSGDPALFLNWHTGQPNSSDDCAYIINGLWYVWPCRTISSFICYNSEYKPLQ